VDVYLEDIYTDIADNLSLGTRNNVGLHSWNIKWQ